LALPPLCYLCVLSVSAVKLYDWLTRVAKNAETTRDYFIATKPKETRCSIFAVVARFVVA
jgi:hypothetical protein